MYYADQFIETLTEVENSVSCDGAFEKYCTSLRRYPCGRTAHTCGACLPSYIGDSGDHNVLCISSSSRNSVKKSSIVSMISTTCSTFLNCVGFQQCLNGICVVPNQICPDSSISTCSGHGNCTYVSHDTGYLLPSCLVGNPLCYSVCKCKSGSYGLGCALNLATFTTNRKLKDVLVTGLYNQTLTHDPEAENVVNWATTSASLAMNYDQITPLSLKLLTAIITTVLIQANILTVPYAQVCTCCRTFLMLPSILSPTFLLSIYFYFFSSP